MSDRMRIATKTLARIRELGGKPVWDETGQRIFVAGHWKLPAKAHDAIRDYAPELAIILRAEAAGNTPDQQVEFEERAAIIEFDGGLSRPAAEYLTNILLSSCPADVSPADWTWFVGKASQALDSVPMRAAA